MKIEIESKYNVNDTVYIKYKVDVVIKCWISQVIAKSFIDLDNLYATKIYYRLRSNADHFTSTDYEEMYVYDNAEQCMK